MKTKLSIFLTIMYLFISVGASADELILPDPSLKRNFNDLPAPVINKKKSRTSLYNIVFVDNIAVSQDPIQQNQPLDILVKFANNGTTDFNGKYCSAIFNSDSEFVEYLDIKENMSLAAGYGYYTNPLIFSSASITVKPGVYYIYIYYKPAGTSEWLSVSSGSYGTCASLTVEGLSYDLAHIDNMVVAPNPVQQGKAFDVQVKFANIGNGDFKGKLCAAYFNSDNEFAGYAEIKNNVSLPGGTGYYTDPLEFHSDPVTDEGTYFVYVYYCPADTSEWILIPTGNYSSFVILEVVSLYDLVIVDNIAAYPNPVQQEQALEVQVKFANTGAGDFNGKLCAAYFDSDNEFAGYIEIKENMSVLGEFGYYTDPLTFHSDSITGEPGAYTIYVYYKPAGTADWIPIPSGNYANNTDLKIETGSLYNLSLHSSITVIPNPVKQNQAVDVTADIINNSTTVFNGTYCAAIFDSSEEFVDYIEIKNNMTLSAAHTDSLSFHSNAINIAPGDYCIYIFHKPDNGKWIKTGSGAYANPVSTTIEPRAGTYTISGHVRNADNNGINGATISFSNSAGSGVTNISGYYSKNISQGWSGTVTPVMNGYLFYPANRSYSNLASDQSGQNFTGTIGSYIISGYVTDSNNNGISGVTLNFSDGGGSAITDTEGYYSKPVDYNWTGIVTPGKNNYSFTPVSRSYTYVTSVQSFQNFTGNSYALPDINLSPGSLFFTHQYAGPDTRIFTKPDSIDKARAKVRAQMLFEQVSESGLQLSVRQNELLDNLKNQDSTAELRIAGVNTDLLKADDTVNLNMFEDENYMAFRTRTEHRGENDFSWHGDIGNGEYAMFIVRDDKITGMIYAGNNIYAVRNLSDDLHVIIRQDISKFPPDYHYEEQIAPTYKRKSAPRSETGESVQNVLVAYTEEAAREAGDISSLIQLAIDQTNQSYRNSNVSLRLQLVHTYQTDYNEIGTTTDLSRFTYSGDGYMDEVHALRDSFHADIAILFVNNGNGYAGVAWVNCNVNPKYGFGVVLHQYATGNYTFAHEVGHIQGARHNPEEDPETYPFPYGHGYLNTRHGWRTIMSYNSTDCSGSYCTRILYWSNPGITYEGAATGTASTHNNARVLNETANSVANFRISDSVETLTIQNIGGSPLRITSISGNRDWLSVSGYPAAPFDIAEGESRTIKVDINWEMVRLSTQGSITINSNDPDEPSVTVQVTLVRTSADIQPQLSVLPDIQEVKASGGITSLIVDNTGSGTMYWTAETNDSWVSVIDGESGTNHKLVTVSCDANLGYERTGTITVSAPGAVIDSQTVRIKQGAHDPGNVEIKGSVLFGDQPLCAMVLANGQYTFSCTGTGEYKLNVPPNENGEITLHCFCDGFAPFIQVLSAYEEPEIDIMMLPAGSDNPGMKVTYQLDMTDNPGWVKISGEVLAEDGTPLCAMVLANGQHMFSCAGEGRYEMEVPLNTMGEITLFGFAEGFLPFKEILKP